MGNSATRLHSGPWLLVFGLDVHCGFGHGRDQVDGLKEALRCR